MNKVITLPKSDILYKYSNPQIAQQKANKYLGPNIILYKSNAKNKKYAIIDPNNHIVNFGQLGYSDYTKTKDPVKQKHYLTRSAKIKGNWSNNKYSPNNLSRNILW